MIKLSAAALSCAQRPGFKALLFSDVKAPAEGAQSAACSEAAADLTKMGLTVLTQHIFYGKAIGRRSERTTMAAVVKVEDEADRWLRSIANGRPLDGSALQTAENIGAITLRDGSVKVKAQLLPFNGCEYGTFAYIDTVLLLNEAHASERLDLTQRLMINPMVRTVAAEMVTATDAAIAQHEAQSASEGLEPIQRSVASKKAAHQRSMKQALGRIAERPEEYIMVASQPLQSFPCLDALDATAQLITRDDGNTESARRRASLAAPLPRRQ